MNYNQMIKAINEAPVTYLPALYKEIVRVAKGKKALIEKECIQSLQENSAVVSDESSIELTPTAKAILFELVNSHAKLTQDLYRLDHSYNNAHYSYQAEERAMEFFKAARMLDEFLDYYKTALPVRTVVPMIKVNKKTDGLWLEFSLRQGNTAVVNVQKVAQVFGGFIGETILGTCEEIAAKGNRTYSRKPGQCPECGAEGVIGKHHSCPYCT